MAVNQYSAKTNDEVIREFASDFKNGLSQKEAEARIKKFGQNEIKAEALSPWRILIRQLKSSFIYLLIGAALLAFFLGQFLDGTLILIFILINASLGFYQEYRSEKTLRLLKEYIVSNVKVLRSSEFQVIDKKNLVCGDIIVLETGDQIPADVRFLEIYNVSVDESILTGESSPVYKQTKPGGNQAGEKTSAENLGLAGTTIVSGKAKAIVIATGVKSSFGKISALTLGTSRVSNFEKDLKRFSSFVLKLVSLTLILVFAFNLFLKNGQFDFFELLIFCIALAVSVIPEALPVVMTFSLARGALILAKKKVVVKRLSAVEDLGGIEILCTDKTGTLTENKLTVSEFYYGSRPEALLYANLAASEIQETKIEPFDIALSQALSKNESYKLKKYERVSDLPFNPQTRRNLVLVKKGIIFELIARGAPEEILNLCQGFSAKDLKAINYWIISQGQIGRRVIGVAAKKMPAAKAKKLNFDLEKENNFNLIGIISFTDPIKKSALAAVSQAKQLGLEIKMLTGDSPQVAGAVAAQIGLAKSAQEVILGRDFEKASADKKRQMLKKYFVFARVNPEQKYQIIELLQKNNRLGFLGEGINDAPALKLAGVSLVVQSAAEIARQAADIVLLKKDLAVVIDGIKEGRKVFANTIKYIRATLASNFGNFYALAIVSLFIDFLPILPIQILLINLLSDFPMIAVATDNIDPVELKKPKKYEVKEIIFLATTLGIVSTVFDFIFFGVFVRFSPAILQTSWFIGSILTELILIFSIRTRYWFFKAAPPSKIINWLTVLIFFVTVIFPFTALGQNFFHFIKPTFGQLTLIFMIVGLYFITTELVKIYYYRYLNQTKES